MHIMDFLRYNFRVNAIYLLYTPSDGLHENHNESGYKEVPSSLIFITNDVKLSYLKISSSEPSGLIIVLIILKASLLSAARTGQHL